MSEETFDQLGAMRQTPRVISAPAKFQNAPFDADKLKGLYEYTYETGLGLTIDCYLMYEEGFDGGDGQDSEESYPESIALMFALINGVDISEVIIDSETHDSIKTAALAAMKTDSFESECDRGQDRYEERMAA